MATVSMTTDVVMLHDSRVGLVVLRCQGIVDRPSHSRVAEMVRSHTVLHTRSRVRNPPMLMYKYVDKKGSAAMLAIKSSAGITSKVNLRDPFHAGDETLERGDFHWL